MCEERKSRPVTLTFQSASLKCGICRLENRRYVSPTFLSAVCDPRLAGWKTGVTYRRHSCRQSGIRDLPVGKPALRIRLAGWKTGVTHKICRSENRRYEGARLFVVWMPDPTQLPLLFGIHRARCLKRGPDSELPRANGTEHYPGSRFCYSPVTKL